MSNALQRSLDIIEQVFGQAPTLEKLFVTKKTRIWVGRYIDLPIGVYPISKERGYKNATRLDFGGNVLVIDRLSSFGVMGSGCGHRIFSNGFIQTRDNYPANGDENRVNEILTKMEIA